MQIGMIGLGRMGGNMARRLTKGGHQCVVFDRNRENVNALAKEGPAPAYSLEELVEKLSAPRALWIMLPSGAPTEETVAALSKPLESGDAIIDGGNSYYVDDIRRAKELASKGIHYVDVGTSGGIWGLERGYCMMIGGERDVIQQLDPIFATLAPGIGSIPRTPGPEKVRAVRQFHARAREGSIVSRCFLRSANFWLQNCAIPRNAARIGFVPSTHEKQAMQRCENIRNSLGLN
jgi:6-phosphogluconate dehydrogenase